MDKKFLFDCLISNESITISLFLLVIITLYLIVYRQKKRISGLENFIYKNFGNNTSTEIKELIDKLSEVGEIPLRILNNYFNIYEKRSFIID